MKEGGTVGKVPRLIESVLTCGRFGVDRLGMRGVNVSSTGSGASMFWAICAKAANEESGAMLMP